MFASEYPYYFWICDLELRIYLVFRYWNLEFFMLCYNNLANRFLRKIRVYSPPCT
jgi:hypothetical protein